MTQPAIDLELFNVAALCGRCGVTFLYQVFDVLTLYRHYCDSCQDILDAGSQEKP